MSFDWADLITILILVVLEGILSVDNVLVLAVLVLPLPEEQQRKALRYGLIGAFALRGLVTVLAIYLLEVRWVGLVGGLYLLYLPIKHFWSHPDEEHPSPSLQPAGAPPGLAGLPPVRLPDTPLVPATVLGLSAFWSTIVKVEFTDLVFAVDSILVAVAMTNKTWVIITGGVLGILMMRLIVIQVLELVKRYPKLIDGAYLVVLWVGIKLVWEYLHTIHWVSFALPKPVALGVVVALLVGSFLYARRHQAEDPGLVAAASDAEALLVDKTDRVPASEGD